MSKLIYPEWVQAQRTKGTTVKKVGNNYYLYKHSSKRLPGKKIRFQRTHTLEGLHQMELLRVVAKRLIRCNRKLLSESMVIPRQ